MSDDLIAGIIALAMFVIVVPIATHVGRDHRRDRRRLR